MYPSVTRYPTGGGKIATTQPYALVTIAANAVGSTRLGGEMLRKLIRRFRAWARGGSAASVGKDIDKARRDAEYKSAGPWGD